MMMNLFKTFAFASVLLAGVTVGQECGPTNGDVTIAGSSTVEPIARAWATGYKIKCPTVNVTVQGGGSSVGAGRVCGQASRGTPVDIGDMSRKWNVPTEVTTPDQVNYTCVIGDTSRKVTQIEVAIDGLTIAMVAGGYGANCVRLMGGLTIDQLRWIYSNFTTAQLVASGWSASALANSDNNDTSHKWSELNAGCRDTEIKIAGADALSGTNAFFVETVFKAGEGFDNKRPGGYFNSSVDEVLVNFVETSSELEYGDAIAYFGFSFYLEEGLTLYGAPIRNAGGNFIIPNRANIESGAYEPFGRRLYMQVHNNATALEDVRPFMQFGLSNAGTVLTDGTGYVSLPLAERNTMLARLGAPDVSDVVVTPTDDNVATDDPTPPPPTPSADCGLLGLSFFCPINGCGFFRRLFNRCD